ncbi:UNVERIFIED_CONTAM: hypothetical protein PYX00_002744 [Menopon gallinae]|uniref:Uncharacterized protein n=1 Tax=Menopon gallinae TaxID=328185 RepID=A0AAW2HYN4_9NEOP
MFSSSRRKLSNLLKHVKHESPEFQEVILSLLKDYLNGQWQNATSKNIHIEKLRGGMSNYVFQITLPQVIQKEVKDEPKTVIVRLYQSVDENSTYQHMSDTLAYICLSERKFGPKLFGIFPGGRIEEYIDAKPLKASQIRQPNFSCAIAEKIAIIHSMTLPLSKKRDLLFDFMNNWLVGFNKNSQDWKIETVEDKDCFNKFKSTDLMSEVSWLRTFLGNNNAPLLFCHNDLQQGNILVCSNTINEKKPKLVVIDYEYSFYNYRAFDFANHFYEYTMNYESNSYPYFVIDEKLYPSPEIQVCFFRQYLRVFNELQRLKGNNDSYIHSCLDNDDSVNDVSEEEHKLLIETSNFRLASNLFWAIWAAFRSRSSTNFKYWEYCIARLDAYYRVKEEITKGLKL